MTLMAAALTVAGCAGSQVASLERRLRALEDENFALRQEAERGSATAEAAVTTSETPATPAPEKAAHRRQPVPVVVGVGGPYGSPMLGPTGGPPQNLGKLYVPPRIPGCNTGPFSLEIENSTNYFIRLSIDGEEIVEGGASGPIPALPPGQHTFVCLASLGVHAMQGIAYARRGADLIEVNRFDIRQVFNTGNMATWGRHYFRVDDTLLNFY